MRGGRLDRLITIQRKTLTQSDSGEPVQTWSDLATRRPASMSPVRGDEAYSIAQTVAQELMEFRVRYSSVLVDLNPQDRIIEPALPNSGEEDDVSLRRLYDVQAVHELGRREGLRIIALRRPDLYTAEDSNELREDGGLELRE